MSTTFSYGLGFYTGILIVVSILALGPVFTFVPGVVLIVGGLRFCGRES